MALPITKSEEDNMNELIQVAGAGAVVTAQIVSHLAQYMAKIPASAIRGIALEISETRLALRVAFEDAEDNYYILASENVARRVARAITRAEEYDYHPLVRDRLITQLCSILDEAFAQKLLEQEQRRQRFGL